MRSEVRSVGECAPTVITLERFLPRVSPQVPLEQPRSRKGLSAQFAATWQRVSAYVHLESADRRVDLVTLVTVVFLARLASGGAVELPVFRQTVQRRVALLAARALKSRGRKTHKLLR